MLTLCDADTPICLAGRLNTGALRAWIAFHTGAPFSGSSHCSIAFGHWADLLPLSAYPIGTSEYPYRLATLFVEVAPLTNEGSTLKGPEIRDAAPLSLPDAHAWLAEERRGEPSVGELSIEQIREQLTLAVNRVMAEGSLYDPDLAALAIKQSRGDLPDPCYCTTLPRFGISEPLDTGAMACDRRISATFRDVPGGQTLGPTFDYTHRLLDFKLAAEGEDPVLQERETEPTPVPHVTEFLKRECLFEETAPGDTPPRDLTRESLEMPADRPLRLQAPSRADAGFTLAMAYSTQRGYARKHAFVGELRIGAVPVEMEIPELGFAVEIGGITLIECETVNRFKGSKTEPPRFTRGYRLVFGQSERKAISMALVDRALRWEELGEDDVGAPTQDTEFVLYHADNIQASGFWSISNCRITSIFNPNWNWWENCTARPMPTARKRLPNDRLQFCLF